MKEAENVRNESLGWRKGSSMVGQNGTARWEQKENGQNCKMK